MQTQDLFFQRAGMMRSFLVLFSVFCLVLGDESIVIYDGVTGELENAFQDWR